MPPVSPSRFVLPLSRHMVIQCIEMIEGIGRTSTPIATLLILVLGKTIMLDVAAAAEVVM
jgi:hypothetical protein